MAMTATGSSSRNSAARALRRLGSTSAGSAAASSSSSSPSSSAPRPIASKPPYTCVAERSLKLPILSVSRSNGAPLASLKWFSTSSRGNHTPSAPRSFPPRSIRHDPSLPRTLPSPPSKTPLYLSLLVLSIASWTLFTLYATNLERSSSSVFRSVLTTLKDHPEVREFMGGEPVRVEAKWWLGGRVWVRGNVSMMQGKVDIAFRIRGPEPVPSPSAEGNNLDKGATTGSGSGSASKSRTEPVRATVYFTSVRPSQGAAFDNVRFLLVDDQGRKLSLVE